LSSQLYEKSTHFLLELIQNADDNTYNTPTPTLSFSYAPGSLRIDCNEVGFTADNVEAICAINQSTKSNKKNDGDYIGEKGIGFKSVFKAADVAWIASREYTFKFDQTKFLGMVTPVWAEFPGEIWPGWTSIHLSLSKSFEETALVQELRMFDANLLIFLRHVKEIQIRIVSESGHVEEQKISKCEVRQGHDRIIALRVHDGINRYLIRTYIIENLPREKKRLDWNRTKILLGFPVAQRHEAPQHIPQKVYAYLPMKYIWPWYLPDPVATTNGFFDLAMQTIMTNLRELPVLESCAGTMEKAASLKHVPSDMFIDGSGTPFTLTTRTATKYLSPTYPNWAVQGTISIGVSQLSSREFLEDLESLIREDRDFFCAKSQLWHTQLAESLYKLTTDDQSLSLMQKIYLIPLQDGTWASAEGKSMFFAKGESSLEVPSGINVLIVDGAAESDAHRRKLLVSLGVKAWEAPEICRLILRVHGSPGFDATALTPEQLISHAAFFYKSSWQLPKDVDIWFATVQDERCFGRKLYIDGSITSDSSMSRVFAKLRERFPVIHNGYLEAFSSDLKWPHWLVDNLGLSMVPRLVTPLIEPKPQAVSKTQVSEVAPPASSGHGQTTEDLGIDLGNIDSALGLPNATYAPGTAEQETAVDGTAGTRGILSIRLSISIKAFRSKPSAQDHDVKVVFTLSDDFIYMFSECQSSDVLQILRENWHHFSRWIDGAHMSWQDREFVASSVELKNRLGSCIVSSASGTVPLRETILPAIDPRLDDGCIIPALDIMTPQHADWRLLGSVGVVLTADVHYYLRCLISISEHDHADIDHVAYIYDKIQSFYRVHEPIIRAAFFERNVVLTRARQSKSSKSRTWINMHDCLARNIAIDYEYPSSSYLFRCLSSPSGDPIASLVAIAALISSSSKLEDISRLFRNISKALKNVTPSEAAQLLRPLQKRNVFPILNDSGNHVYDRLSSIGDTSWFIADRPLIRKSFQNKLPLLALSTGDIAASEDLLRVLRLEDRLLSKLATSRTTPVGRVKTHWAWTSSLRAKRQFFKALIPRSHSSSATIMHRIENIRGNVAPFISQMYTMKAGSVMTEGNSIAGRTSLSVIGNSLSLFLTEELANTESPPYELSILLADELKIEDVGHRSLLYTVLMNSSLENIHSTFVQQGIEVDGLSRYLAHRGDLTRIPSPFWGSMTQGRENGFRGLDGSRFDRFRSERYYHHPNEDRRLPMNTLMRLDRSLVEGLQAVPARLVGREHIQHLGEHLTSKILQTHLGHLYDPERDWTSELRSRSGHQPFQSFDSYAAFTLKGHELARQMTAFVTSFGRQTTPNWNAILPRVSPIYHLDVVVNRGSTSSSFVLNTSQIERVGMRRYTMAGQEVELDTDINIALLLKISDVYLSNAPSAELIVDPWRLLCSSNLRLDTEWMLTATLAHDSLEHPRKKRKLPTLSVPWLAEGNLTSRQLRSALLEQQMFSHRALRSGEIRLINVLPGTPQDPLQGVVIHVPLKSAPQYRALSYVWGTGQETEELVTLDGTLPITSSLWKALCTVRHKDQSTTLWVDAICINQRDGKEKAKQIRKLPVIFQNASFTYAFLEGGDSSDSALEMLMQVGEDGSEEDDWPDDLCKVPTSWRDDPVPHLDDEVWTSVKTLFSLPFFRRVWIIQEIVAAWNVKFVCGRWTIDWSDLHLAMEIVDRQVQLSDTDTTHLTSTWEPFLSLAAQREWEARSHRWSLSMLLEHFRYAQSTLSRDRLFALLGLASDGNEADFEPDYDSPLQEVLLKFARVFVRQGGGMQLLYRAGLQEDLDGATSWVPDWTVQRPTSLADVSEGGITFAASGPQQPVIECSPDSDELLVGGYAVDEVEIVSVSSNVEEELSMYFNEVDKMIDDATISPTQTSREDLKWKVPIAGALFPKVATSGGGDLRSSYAALRNSLNFKGKGKGKSSVDNTMGFVHHENNNSNNHTGAYTTFLEKLAANAYHNQGQDYLAILGDTVRGWRFVATKKGYVGTVPNRTKAGDTIAIMKGGRVPFVLRKSDARATPTFRLVGECYVHDLMNGHGLSLPGVEETTFTLY
ncbi:hypothetical protein BDW02DRAFT_486530, partial [Decorospora gaudefroyi]